MEIRSLILAAGKGKRMGQKVNKMLIPLMQKPLLKYVVEANQKLNPAQIIIVVGSHNHSDIKQELGSAVTYVEQQEPQGTGHAVMVAEAELKTFSGNLLVMVGDAPFITADVLQQLVEEKEKKNAACAFLTTQFNETPAWGRVIRDSDGKVLKIVEEKDASSMEKKVREVSSSHYCFDSKKLFKALKHIGNYNAQNEYYLPDVIAWFIENKEEVIALNITENYKTMGINTPIELQNAEQKMRILTHKE